VLRIGPEDVLALDRLPDWTDWGVDVTGSAPISRVGLPNEVYSCTYGRLYNDAVTGPDGRGGTYLRWVWAGGGVVAVPTDGSRVYLWPMYRYPIGSQSLEFPRGAMEAGESAAEAAARELCEETGFTAVTAEAIGTVHADTGLITTSNAVVLAHIDAARPGRSRLEATEAVAGPSVAVTGQEMNDLIRRGGVTCALTIAAFVHALPHLGGGAVAGGRA
jgi:ADP-ribose diphosphatase